MTISLIASKQFVHVVERQCVFFEVETERLRQLFANLLSQRPRCNPGPVHV